MAEKEEPTYMSVARFNAKHGHNSTPLVVKELLERIDRQDRALTEVQNELRSVKQRFH